MERNKIDSNEVPDAYVLLSSNFCITRSVALICSWHNTDGHNQIGIFQGQNISAVISVVLACLSWWQLSSLFTLCTVYAYYFLYNFWVGHVWSPGTPYSFAPRRTMTVEGCVQWIALRIKLDSVPSFVMGRHFILTKQLRSHLTLISTYKYKSMM